MSLLWEILILECSTLSSKHTLQRSIHLYQLQCHTKLNYGSKPVALSPIQFDDQRVSSHDAQVLRLNNAHRSAIPFRLLVHVCIGSIIQVCKNQCQPARYARPKGKLAKNDSTLPLSF